MVFPQKIRKKIREDCLPKADKAYRPVLCVLCSNEFLWKAVWTTSDQHPKRSSPDEAVQTASHRDPCRSSHAHVTPVMMCVVCQSRPKIEVTATTVSRVRDWNDGESLWGAVQTALSGVSVGSSPDCFMQRPTRKHNMVSCDIYRV